MNNYFPSQPGLKACFRLASYLIALVQNAENWEKKMHPYIVNFYLYTKYVSNKFKDYIKYCRYTSRTFNILLYYCKYVFYAFCSCICILFSICGLGYTLKIFTYMYMSHEIEVINVEFYYCQVQIYFKILCAWKLYDILVSST